MKKISIFTGSVFFALAIISIFGLPGFVHAEQTASTASSTATSTQKEYYFGGMYGTGADTTGNTDSTKYTNPLANDRRSCPTGYKSQKILGTFGYDFELYACIGDSTKVKKVAQFGGIFGSPSSAYTNPLAGDTKGCPARYTKKVVYGTKQVVAKAGHDIFGLPGMGNMSGAPRLPGMTKGNDGFPGDFTLAFCYAATTTPAVVKNFGGIWGSYVQQVSSSGLPTPPGAPKLPSLPGLPTMGDSTKNIAKLYLNPISTSGRKCSADQTSKTVFGTYGTDYAVGFCYKKI